MHVSFDSVRKILAENFNDMVATRLSKEQAEVMLRMRDTISVLLMMYTESKEGEQADCNDLSESVGLDDVNETGTHELLP